MTTSDKNCFICAVDDELPLLLHFYQSARSTSNPKVHAGWCKTADIWNIYTRPCILVGRDNLDCRSRRDLFRHVTCRVLSRESLAQAHELCRSASSTLPQACALHFSLKKSFVLHSGEGLKPIIYREMLLSAVCVFFGHSFSCSQAEELKNSYLKGFSEMALKLPHVEKIFIWIDRVSDRCRAAANALHCEQ